MHTHKQQSSEDLKKTCTRLLDLIPEDPQLQEKLNSFRLDGNYLSQMKQAYTVANVKRILSMLDVRKALCEIYETRATAIEARILYNQLDKSGKVEQRSMIEKVNKELAEYLNLKAKYYYTEEINDKLFIIWFIWAVYFSKVNSWRGEVWNEISNLWGQGDVGKYMRHD